MIYDPEIIEYPLAGTSVSDCVHELRGTERVRTLSYITHFRSSLYARLSLACDDTAYRVCK